MEEPSQVATPAGVETTKVLIADDDPPTRVLLRTAIAQWGYTVVEAKDGEEAWELLQKPDAPRLLILDWLMPKLDGVELCRRIKQESTFRPYIILLTQLVGTSNVVKGLEAGADEFLSKPFNMAELRSRLTVGMRMVKFENQSSTPNQPVETKPQERVSGEVQPSDTDKIKIIGDLITTTMQQINDIINAVHNQNGQPKDATGPLNPVTIRDLLTALINLADILKSLSANPQDSSTPVVATQINDCIERVLVICQSQLIGVQVEKKLMTDLPPIVVNPQLLQQAFLMLMLIITGGLPKIAKPVVSIITTLEGSNIRIVFNYSREAFSETEIANFFQLPAKSMYAAISKEILGKYSGTINVENNPEGGVCLVIYMPTQKPIERTS